jgi:hypothetical protein
MDVLNTSCRNLFPPASIIPNAARVSIRTNISFTLLFLYIIVTSIVTNYEECLSFAKRHQTIPRIIIPIVEPKNEKPDE